MTSQNKIIQPKTPIREINPLLFIDNIQGFIPTTDSVPTSTPTKLSEQFMIYNNTGTFRFYWYDTINAEWRFAAGT